MKRVFNKLVLLLSFEISSIIIPSVFLNIKFYGRWVIFISLSYPHEIINKTAMIHVFIHRVFVLVLTLMVLLVLTMHNLSSHLGEIKFI